MWVEVSSRWESPLAEEWGCAIGLATGIAETAIPVRDSNTGRKANGGVMLPEELNPVPGEGLSAGLIFHQAGKVPMSASVGKDA